MGKSLKGQFKSVDRFNSKYLIILNDEDLKNNEVVIKDNHTREESRIKVTEIVDFLDNNLCEDGCDCGDCHCEGGHHEEI